MPTNKQKQAFKILQEEIVAGNVPPMTKIMQRAGFSVATSRRSDRLVHSKGWQELLAKIDDEPLLNKLNSIAIDNEDKRASIEAIKEIFKLKDRYPAGKLKVTQYEEELKEYVTPQ